MPDSPAPPPPSPLAPQRERRRKAPLHLLKLALASGFLLLLLLHRPLLHWTLTRAAQTWAAKNGFALQVQLAGSVWTSLQIHSLELLPLSSPTSNSEIPLKSLQIENAELHYNPARLLWSGPQAFLTSYRIEGIDGRFQAPKPLSPASSSPPSGASTFFEKLESWLHQPALYADTVEIRQLNLFWNDGNDDPTPLRVLRNLEFTAYPDRPGQLKIESFSQADRHPWERLEASTTYANRHLTLSGLRLRPELEIASLHWDASERASGKALLSAEIRFRNEPLRFSYRSQRPNGPQPGQFHVQLAATRLAWGDLLQSLELPPLGPSQLPWLEAHLQGDPQSPASWTGEAHLHAQFQVQSAPAPIWAEFHGAFRNGTLHVDSIHASLEANSASASGTLRLAPSLKRWDLMNGSLRARLDLEDFSSLGIPSQQAQPFGFGVLTGNLDLKEGQLTFDLQGEAQAAGSLPVEFSRAQLQARLRGPLRNLHSWQGFSGEGQCTLQNPGFYQDHHALRFPEASLTLSLAEKKLLATASLSSPDNQVEARAEVNLQRAPNPFAAELSAKLPFLEKLGWRMSGHALSGTLSHLAGQWKGSWSSGHPINLQGRIEWNATHLHWGAFDLAKASGRASLDQSQIALEDLSFGWSPEEQIHAQGTLGLQNPRPYRIQSQVKLGNLQRLEPLFRQAGMQTGLSGQLMAEGDGEGTLQPLSGRGSWKLLLKNGRWKSADLKEISCTGSFQEGLLNVSPCRIVTPQTQVNAQVSWKEGTLRIQEIALQQWGYAALSGYLMLPLDFGPEGLRWNPTGRLAGQLQADHLDLVSLFSAAGQPPPVAGRLTCGITLQGNPVNPELNLQIQASELRIPEKKGLGQAKASLSASVRDHSFSLDAELLSDLKTPVQIHADFPLPLPELLAGKKSVYDLPLQGRIHASKANLGILPALWPGFKKFEGTLSLEASLQGPIRALQYRGSLQLKAPVIHFVSYRFPAIVDLELNLQFDPSALRLQQLKGNVGGGAVSAEGLARWTQPANPDLDFRVRAHEMLIVRGRELSLRLDGDLRLLGPWRSATISGQGFAVKSRVTRDIDLLPTTVSALKRSSPTLPTTQPGKPWFTFPRSPFSEWKWDVALKTRLDDPLLIRGNRLHGSAHADLRLRGTGAAPTLDGHYNTTDLVAYLPFARIAVSRGHFWYFPNQPFRTQLDFTAETDVRQHRVRIYLTGTPETPKINLNSDPPLPESDLLNLITTGVLPSDTNENAPAMAGRAAAVLFQELSGKLFDYSSNRERPSALQRFNLNVGTINTRTGHQETTLSYRLSDRFFILGELGANGDFGGQIRYLIRFR